MIDDPTINIIGPGWRGIAAAAAILALTVVVGIIYIARAIDRWLR